MFRKCYTSLSIADNNMHTNVEEKIITIENDTSKKKKNTKYGLKPFFLGIYYLGWFFYNAIRSHLFDRQIHVI